MSRDRGIRLQNALAAYLQQLWPLAESAGSGRPGRDILNTIGVAFENKTADEWNILAWVKQAKAHVRDQRTRAGTAADIPIVIYWPRGSGEKSVESTLSIVPTGVMVRLLREAGYGSD